MTSASTSQVEPFRSHLHIVSRRDFHAGRIHSGTLQSLLGHL
jgi:hypothetical protein